MFKLFFSYSSWAPLRMCAGALILLGAAVSHAKVEKPQVGIENSCDTVGTSESNLGRFSIVRIVNHI